jgi:pimeloyl-ACP methyl ester carboxylesterase
VCDGIGLRVHEWGDPSAAPLVLSHGFFDHGRGFELLAPRLAERFRVVSYDARGHGRSDWADAYTWTADLDDLLAVLHSLDRPAHLLGHSRGGSQATDAAVAAPDHVRQLVNLDGFGPPPEGFSPPGRPRAPEVPVPTRFAGFLDRRRRAVERGRWRAYPSFEDLVERRGEQNPRLGPAWLRRFLAYSALETEEGWTWSMDPLLTDGFGPWRPEWIAPLWRRLRAPLLAVTGSEPDTWGPLPEPLLAERLAHVPRAERAVIEGAGHFIHMERPAETAALVLAWLER